MTEVPHRNFYNIAHFHALLALFNNHSDLEESFSNPYLDDDSCNHNYIGLFDFASDDDD